MKQLFLTSSVHAVAHDIVKHVDLSTGNKLVFITTPAEDKEGDKTWLRNDRQALVNAGFDVTDYTITGKTFEQLKADLTPYRFIYMSGGNTLYLLIQSQKSQFTKLIADWINSGEKIYIGTSAGSIITGPKCPDYYLTDEESKALENENGYGLVNFTIMPHWGSDHFKERYLNGRLQIAYKTDQIPFILLTDNQYIHVQNDMLQIIDLTHKK